ncbi:MAG TPA: phage holin family protein [Thermoleophilia bacterium]|nr:phage holin family protein [Thermoleophilia bacterium]
MPRTDAKRHLGLHFRVRPLLVGFFVSALSLALTVLVVPHVFYSGDYPVLSWFLISAVFGLLMAFVKPLLQLVLLPLLFVSFGLVIVLINTIVLWLLALLFPARFHYDHLIWLVVAGLVSGFLITLFADLFGLSPPIIEGGTAALREEMARAKPGHVEEQLLEAASRGKQKHDGGRSESDSEPTGEERP